MPKLSIFTPCGLLRMTSAPADARVIFESKKASLGANRLRPAYAIVTPGSRLEARLYAESIREAVIRMLLRRAGEADLPHRIHPELVPLREVEYGVTPAAGDSIQLRKGHLEAAYRLPGGGDRINIENAMRALLGAGFLYYRTLHAGERVSYPASAANSPINFQLPEVKRVVVRVDPVNGISLPSATPQHVYYIPFIPAAVTGGVPLLQKDDVIVVEPEISARTERVKILEVGSDLAGTWVRGVFLNAHEPGAVATTYPFPFWVTNQRFSLIIVTAAVAADTNAVRRIHIIMQTLARGVSTWAVAAATGPGTTGPFQINISPLGSTTLGILHYP